MLNFTPSGNETFDAAFTKAYNLIMSKYPNSTVDVNSTTYYDMNIRMRKADYGLGLLTLDEAGKILNAMLDGSTVNSYVDKIMISFVSFFVNDDYASHLDYVARPYYEYSDLTHSLINNICKLLSHGITWPFDTINYHGLHPVVLNYLLSIHTADDNWWANAPVVKNDTLTDAEYLSETCCVDYHKYITTHKKISRNIPNILDNVFNDNLLIPISMINTIITDYGKYFKNKAEFSFKIVKRLQSIANTGASLYNLNNLDNKTIENNVYNTKIIINEYLHGSFTSDAMKINEYISNDDYGVLMIALANVIINNNYDDNIVVLLSKLIIEIKSAYTELYDYSCVEFGQITSSYPEIVHDTIIYPTEFVKEMIKTVISDNNSDDNADSQESNSKILEMIH